MGIRLWALGFGSSPRAPKAQSPMPKALPVVFALTLLALWPAWRVVTRPDLNIFNQPAGGLQRLGLMRQLREDFGGDILAAVVSIPDRPSSQQVQEMKAFALLLASELAQAGSLAEDRADLSAALRQELPSGVPWLRQVECRTGQGIERAVRKMIKDRAYVVLIPGDVDVLKKLFEPPAVASALERLAAMTSALPPGSAEAVRLQEDPLGIAEIARETLRKRLALRREALAGNDPKGFFLSPDRTTLVVLGRIVLPATRADFNVVLLRAAQRAENRAIVGFRGSNPSLTTALKSGTYGELARGEQPGTLHVGFTGPPAVSVESPMGLRYNLILVVAACFAGEFILALVFLRNLMLAWHVTWTTAAVIIWTLAVSGVARGAIGIVGGTLACVVLGTCTACAIDLHNACRLLGKRGGKTACLAAGVIAFAAAVVFTKYGLEPELEAVAGVHLDAETGGQRPVKAGAGLLQSRLAERFGSALADVRVLVTAADEDRAYAGMEVAVRRLQPFVERAELSPGGSILDFVPSARQQRETIAALKTFDFTAAAKAFKAAAMEQFGSKASRFEPFLERLRRYGSLTREPAPLTLANVMSTPLGSLLAPYVRLDPAQVRLATSWFPTRLNMSAQWYEDVARALETDPPQGAAIRVTAARMVGPEIRHSLISLGTAAVLGYTGMLLGALVVLPALLGLSQRASRTRCG